MTGHGWKWLAMAGNERKRMELTGNCHDWTWLVMDGNGWKWLEVEGTGMTIMETA